MPTIPSSLSRVSSAMAPDLLRSNLRRTSVDMLRLQEQLATGLRVNRPSDAPESAGTILSLKTIFQRYEQQRSNLDRAANLADTTDQALSDVSDLLIEARNIASSQIGIGASAGERSSQAAVIDGLLDSLREIGNRETRGVRLFGGRSGEDSPFVDFEADAGGVRYIGSREDLGGDLGEALPIGINTNGADAFGALSSRATGGVDPDPDATPATPITDVNGARGRGVTLAAVSVTVNGMATEVDLSGADSLGDVADRINDVLGGTGSLDVSADGFTLTAGGGQTIQIEDIGSGVTAADLGIDITASGGATGGADLDPRLTALTDVTRLGTSPDLTSGLKITNGGAEGVIDFTGAETVEDMINRVEAAQLGVRLEINGDGTGLNLVNEVSGTDMSIGENAGGTTATDLGLRSFGPDTLLSDFNHGRGVGIEQGADDLRIELANGATADVNLDGAATVQDVIDAINTAAGGDVTASLASDGNGLVLTDTTGGPGTMRIVPLNNSPAASDLGIKKTADASATLRGEDRAAIRTDSAFTHLIMLRDALLNNDERAITLAGEKLGGDMERITTAQAKAGVRANRIQAERERMADQELQTEAMLSGLRDTDYPGAISRFSQLQQQLQANLMSGRELLSMNLLDFLR